MQDPRWRPARSLLRSRAVHWHLCPLCSAAEAKAAESQRQAVALASAQKQLARRTQELEAERKLCSEAQTRSDEAVAKLAGLESEKTLTAVRSRSMRASWLSEPASSARTVPVQCLYGACRVAVPCLSSGCRVPASRACTLPVELRAYAGKSRSGHHRQAGTRKLEG